MFILFSLIESYSIILNYLGRRDFEFTQKRIRDESLLCERDSEDRRMSQSRDKKMRIGYREEGENSLKIH